MNKQLIRLDIVAGESSYDVVTGLLTLLVSSGWEEQSLPTGETRFRVHSENAPLIQTLRQAVEARVPEASCQVDSIVEQDWLTAWKAFFTPVPCGQRFVVLPPWRASEPGFEGRTKIFIEPKSAFGTGHHATTALCLEVLSGLLDEGRLRAGQTFLDLGTGSGVLGTGLCLSGLKGAGFDIDPVAIDNALENRVLNHIPDEQFEIAVGSIEKCAGRSFDVIVANILAGPLKELAADIVRVKAPDGVLILSGLLTIQADSVEESYRACGLPQAVRFQNGEWSALCWK